MWLGFDLCLGSGSVRRLRGAGRAGSGVHGVVRPRRVRGGACGPAGTRVGTIQYVYRSVSIPYSTPVSCMVSPSPNEDPVGTTKCPLNPWFYDIFELIPTTKLLSQKHQKISTNICYHRPAFKCFSKHPANDSHLKLFASLLCTTLPAVQPKRQCFLKHRANDFSALPCLALQLRHKE